MTELPPKRPPTTLSRLQQLVTELEKRSGLHFNTLTVEVAPVEAGADEFEPVPAHDLGAKEAAGTPRALGPRR